MKVGIIGSGQVGKILGTAFFKEGYEVMLGTRNPQKPDVLKWVTDNPGVQSGQFSEAATFGDILVLAIAGEVAEEAVKISGINNFQNKLVLDATNPIAKKPPVNGVLSFFTSLDESLMERIQRIIPEAKLVKVFNSVGSARMYKPSYREGRPSMFICGNDEKAKEKTKEILADFGWDTEDMGKIEAARAIEPLCILWCIPGFLQNQWTHAFKLLKT